MFAAAASGRSALFIHARVISFMSACNITATSSRLPIRTLKIGDVFSLLTPSVHVTIDRPLFASFVAKISLSHVQLIWLPTSVDITGVLASQLVRATLPTV